MSVNIYPKNVKPGDHMLTTAGMREVLSVVRVGVTMRITVQDPSTPHGSAELQFVEDWRKAKVTVERKASKP